MKDEIIEEIHRGRRQWAKKFKHNLAAMFEDLQRSEEEAKASGVKFVSPKKRKASSSRLKRTACRPTH